MALEKRENIYLFIPNIIGSVPTLHMTISLNCSASVPAVLAFSISTACCFRCFNLLASTNLDEANVESNLYDHAARAPVTKIPNVPSYYIRARACVLYGVIHVHARACVRVRERVRVCVSVCVCVCVCVCVPFVCVPFVCI